MNNLNLQNPSLVNNRQNIQNCYWLGQKHHRGFSDCSECSETKGGSHE